MKTFIEIRDGVPFGHPHIEESLKYLSAEFRASLVEVVMQERPTVPFTHLCEELPVYKLSSDGRAHQQWVVRELTAEERAASSDKEHPAHQNYVRAEGEMRTFRNRLLTACDWTQLPDAPLTPEQRTAWSAYRQALRDVPDQSGSPWQISWPQQPNS